MTDWIWMPKAGATSGDFFAGLLLLRQQARAWLHEKFLESPP